MGVGGHRTKWKTLVEKAKTSLKLQRLRKEEEEEEEERWGDLSHKQKRYNYSKKTSTGKAKPIRVIGDPDKQCPDNWSSSVLRFCHAFRADTEDPNPSFLLHRLPA